MIDAVVVIPGIMGSRLVDVDGDTIWGVRRIARLKTVGRSVAQRWAESRVADLELTEAERAGEPPRLRPDGLIKESAWGPRFRLNFGYELLTRHLRELCVHPDALLEFAYDWRLSVEYNGRLLAGVIDRHLERWNDHSALSDHRRRTGNDDDPRVIIVAHSMGGLVARAAGLEPGALDRVRQVITIGTPFRGSVDAVTLLNSGQSSIGLPAGPARALGRTLPGLHDLLPTYRCLLADGDLVELDATAVGRLGGDAELAAESFARHARLASVDLPGLINLAGSHQPTDICFRLTDGVVQAEQHGYARDADDRLRRRNGALVPLPLHGDSTVQWQSARLGPATGYAQKHGALQATKSLIRNVEAQIEQRDPGEGLAGPAELGVELPEYAPAGAVVTARVHGASSAGDFSCVVKDLDDNVAAHPTVHRDEPGYVLRFEVSGPGLYVLEVSGGVEPIRDAVLVTDPGER